MEPIWYTLYKVEKTFKKQGISENGTKGRNEQIYETKEKSKSRSPKKRLYPIRWPNVWGVNNP